jgi:hypothetical protein
MEQHDWSADKAEFVMRPSAAPHPTGEPAVSPLGRQFAELTKRLVRADSVAEVLSQLASATLAVVPDAHLVSVTLRSADGHLHTPVETDPVGE